MYRGTAVGRVDPTAKVCNRCGRGLNQPRAARHVCADCYEIETVDKMAEGMPEIYDMPLDEARRYRHSEMNRRSKALRRQRAMEAA